MNSEQVERTIEFILEHQAQTVVHLEHLASHSRDVQTAILTLSDLADVQSRRLDRETDRLNYHDRSQKEVLARLDEILRRLTDRK